MRISDFLYDLPDEAIAQSAVEPRDASRLLDTRDMSDHRFRELPGLLTPGDLVVVNRTRVRRAKLIGAKVTGGTVEALLLEPLAEGRWKALIGPARRVRPGTTIRFGATTVAVESGPSEGRVVLEAREGVFSLDPVVDDDGVTFRSSYDGSEVRLTPEKSMRAQEALGADIAMAFDELVGLPAPRPVVEAAMQRTLRWAERSMAAHTRPDQSLFGIVQGGRTSTCARPAPAAPRPRASPAMPSAGWRWASRRRSCSRWWRKRRRRCRRRGRAI